METTHDGLGAAEDLLARFARRTGLTGAAPPRRYLWTDAYAVCTYLELERRTGDEAFGRSALALVEQVHDVLGRRRPELPAQDPRAGWLAGDAATARAHPTRAGLRIGKRLPERGAGEPYDERLEWDRDGQYFHYLTKWVHALCRVARAKRSQPHARWAVDLVLAAHRGFACRPPGGGAPRLHWKMSLDLARPLVTSMGQHDPLDGLLTCLEARAAAKAVLGGDALELAPVAADLAEACAALDDLATTDPLGLGGLMTDALRIVELGAAPELARLGLSRLGRDLLRAAARGLGALLRAEAFQGPAARRLAFRELGLALGLHAVEDLARRGGEALGADGERAALLDALARVTPLAGRLEGFWLDAQADPPESWTAHEDINAVMLAASLVPEGALSP